MPTSKALVRAQVKLKKLQKEVSVVEKRIKALTLKERKKTPAKKKVAKGKKPAKAKKKSNRQKKHVAKKSKVKAAKKS